jgi:DUF4097 and DUF4098 domain-containing protein YvlB
MLSINIVAGMAIALGALPAADTSFAVRPGMRLELENREGEIRVTTWGRDEVEITTTSGTAWFDVDQSGSVLRVRPRPGGWRETDRGRRRYEWDEDQGAVVIEMRVPDYLDLDLRGLETDVSVSGTAAEISVRTVEGAIRVDGGRGFVSLNSVEETVELVGAEGRIEIGTAEGAVIVRDCRGEITVESIDGDVELTGIDAERVTATTVDGDVTYEGAIHDGGRYRLSTHDGDVTLQVPERASATVSVTSYDGDFQTEFPIVLRESRRRQFSFTLGEGSALVELQAFDGDIYLKRD